MAGFAAAGLLAIGILAPNLSGDRFAPRIQSALERALGRRSIWARCTSVSSPVQVFR